MARLGRNSIMTQKLAIEFNEKLDEKTLVTFLQWLQIVESDHQMNVRKAERKSRGF
jgi:hypothetical protein